MMKIGGLINKKFNLKKTNKTFLPNGTYLINGRSALLLILLEIRKKFKINEILVPYFACPSIINTIKYSNFRYNFYDTNVIKKKININSNKKKVILVIHYFGFKNNYAKLNKLNLIKIEDFSHLFLDKNLLKISKKKYVFASLRKHSHLRYGAWTNKKFKIDYIDKKTNNFIIRNQKKLFSIKSKDKFQIQGEKFNNIVENKYILKKLPLNLKKNFKKINWQFIKNQRIRNFKYLKNELSKIKLFKFLNLRYNYYPLNFFLLTKKRNHLKKFLSKKGIYTSTYWKVKSNKKFKLSSRLSNQILSLPVDQRYGYKHMKYIIDNLKIYDKNYRV